MFFVKNSTRTPLQLFLLNFALWSTTGRIFDGKYFLIKYMLFDADSELKERKSFLINIDEWDCFYYKIFQK